METVADYQELITYIMPRKLSLRNIDLNLLPVLHALIEEESVKGASERVHLSQSATSSALRRIRDTLEDPILEPNGAKMRLSPKARQIKKLLHESLENTASVLDSFVPVEVGSNHTTIRISGPEHTLIALSGSMETVPYNRSDNITFELDEFRYNSIIEELQLGKVDFAIGPFDQIELPGSLDHQVLYEDNLTVVMRLGHPALAEAVDGHMSVSTLESYKHVVTSKDDSQDGAVVTQLLKSKNIRRQIFVKMPGLIMLSPVLSTSNLISLGSERAGKIFNRAHKLETLKPPKELINRPFRVSLIWRKDQEGICLYDRTREEILRIAKAMPPLDS